MQAHEHLTKYEPYDIITADSHKALHRVTVSGVVATTTPRRGAVSCHMNTRNDVNQPGVVRSNWYVSETLSTVILGFGHSRLVWGSRGASTLSLPLSVEVDELI